LAIHSFEDLELSAGPTGEGKRTEWDGSRQISLSAPILDVTLAEMLDGERITEAREVLKYWLDLDKANLARITTGSLSFVMPQRYETNSITWVARTAFRSFGKQHVNVTEEEVRSSFRTLHTSLLWLARTQMEKGDSLGAALTAMLMRYRDSEDLDSFDVAIRLSRMAGKSVPMQASPSELYKLLDELIACVQGRLECVPDGRADEAAQS